MSRAEIVRIDDRTPLENIEGEAAFLGAALIDNRVLDLAPALHPSHFYEPVHQRICERIFALRSGGAAERRSGGATVTAATLKPYFDGDDALRELGGITYLARLSADASGLLAPRELAEQITELATRRRTRDQAAELAALCGRFDVPAAEIATRLQALSADADGFKSGRALLPYEWAGDALPVLDGNWLIEGFLPKAGPAVIYGHPGSGKTFLALSIGASVAEGAPWAGREVQAGPVLYVVAEGLTGFRNRMAAVTAAGRLSRTAPFIFVPVTIDLLAPDGDTAKLIATLEHFAARTGKAPALVVIDTLSKTFGAGKENSDDMAAYVANWERIAAAFECLTLIVHHRPKSEGQSGERGHGSLRGGIVASILVEGREVKTATTVKQKDGPDGERVAFRLDQVVLGQDSKGRDVTTCLVDFIEQDPADEDTRRDGPRDYLKGHAKTAARILEELLTLHGEAPPDGIPGEVLDRRHVFRVIGSGQVADRLSGEFEGVVDASPDKVADTARRTARRALATLKTKQIIGSWGEWLWLR